MSFTKSGSPPFLVSITSGPNSSDPHVAEMPINQALRIAERHQASGRLQLAEQVLREILRQAPKYPPALHLLGVLAHINGKTENGAELVRKAIAENGSVAIFHANLTEMYRCLGRLDEAVFHGKQAVLLGPDLCFTYGNLAMAYFDLKKYDEAEYNNHCALKINPRFGSALNNMGSIWRFRGDNAKAAQYYQQAVEENPENLSWKANLASTLIELQKPNEALIFLEHVLGRDPSNIHVKCNKAIALQMLGKFTEAKILYLSVVEKDQSYILAYQGLAAVLVAIGELNEAEKWARKWVEICIDSAEAHSALGKVLDMKNFIEEAEVSYKTALSLDKRCFSAIYGMGIISKVKGDSSAAKEAWELCLESSDAVFAMFELIQMKKIKAGDAEIAMLEKVASTMPDNAAYSQKVTLQYALGKMYDDLGQYDRAFMHFSKGASLRRSQLQYNPDTVEQRIEILKKTFTKEFFLQQDGYGSLSDVPVFVLGMPRSGTTLTEQIIASHLDVFGAGELTELASLKTRISAQVGDSYWSDKAINRLRLLCGWGEEYVSHIKGLAPSTAKRIVDKQPLNFFNVGLIKAILPRAKIIHVQRDPLDTCLSGYTTLFGYGQWHSYDLKETGHYYRCYKELMDYWRSALPAGSMYELKYENLVDDLETEARRIIEYCGLEWDDACLDFYKNNRKVQTPSLAQVRQPIYKSSKQRWKNYERHLGPLIEALGHVAK